MSNYLFPKAEAVAHRCSVKKNFLEISQNSQKNTCARVSFFTKAAGLRHRCFPVNFDKFVRAPFFHRTPLVAALEAASFMKFCCSTLGLDKF